MVSPKEATETVLKELTSENIIGCEDGKTVYGFYTLYKGVEFDSNKCYIIDMIYTVDKETGKLDWMDSIEFAATQASRKRDRKGHILSKRLDVSGYLPDDCKEAARKWYEKQSMY